MPHVDLDDLAILLRDHGWKEVGSGHSDPLLWLKLRLEELEEVKSELDQAQDSLIEECDRTETYAEQVDKLVAKLEAIKEAMKDE